MKEAEGYPRMNGFGETLQAELDKVCNYSDCQTMWSGRRMGTLYQNMFAVYICGWSVLKFYLIQTM